jgi:hypothetical protein
MVTGRSVWDGETLEAECLPGVQDVGEMFTPSGLMSRCSVAEPAGLAFAQIVLSSFRQPCTGSGMQSTCFGCWPIECTVSEVPARYDLQLRRCQGSCSHRLCQVM